MAEIVSLADGVAAVVQDGDTVAIEGSPTWFPLPPATGSSARAGAS
jgi:hypothetical protein